MQLIAMLNHYFFGIIILCLSSVGGALFTEPYYKTYLKRYDELSREELILLRKKWSDDENFAHDAIVAAVDIAQHLRRSYPAPIQIYALGQSLAYFALIAQILEELHGGNPDRYHFIAFSLAVPYGSLTHRSCLAPLVCLGNGGKQFQLPRQVLTKDKLTFFYEYLKQLGFFNKAHKDVIVLEFVEHGGGLFTFDALLKTMQNEHLLHESLDVMPLVQYYIHTVGDYFKSIKKNMPPFAFFRNLDDYPVDLRKFEASGEFRIIAPYPYEFWGDEKRAPEKYVFSEAAECLLLRFIDHIKLFCC